MNTLEISSRLDYDQDDKCSYIVSTISVDGADLSNGFTMDWEALAESCRKPGEYFILTCSCGDNGCAGIDRGIIVLHQKETVKWLVPDPMDQDSSGISDIFTYSEKIFDMKDYRSKIHDAMCELRTLALETKPAPVLLPRLFDLAQLEKLIGRKCPVGEQV